MIKVAYGSDIHLEFGPVEIKNTEGADILILAGDICCAKTLWPDYGDPASEKYHSFFRQASKEFPIVLYVMGNHEHYGMDVRKTVKKIKTHLSCYENIHVLDREVFTFKGITFVGATLWSSLNNRDQIVMWQISHCMSDFHVIKYSGKTKFSPAMWCDFHDADLAYLKGVIEKESKVVVITHMTPSYMSCHDKYKYSHTINAAFHTELFEYIHDCPNIIRWIHGHVHDAFEYVIGNTTVSCNPRGYVGYEPVENWSLKVFTIEESE